MTHVLRFVFVLARADRRNKTKHPPHRPSRVLVSSLTIFPFSSHYYLYHSPHIISIYPYNNNNNNNN